MERQRETRRDEGRRKGEKLKKGRKKRRAGDRAVKNIKAPITRKHTLFF